ncbi:E3 ubiquitin-protein ligase UPL3 [Striga hermonthica]|uniref:HECT-type E3 ubiquitin transferase n=1 Tax=Striga hermonthica TaxID=68872 RepID=A0A9N7R8R9_STRHE|nr:E3 ubiquitin-protein ligase UPL3 [Striga hermonthica]
MSVSPALSRPPEQVFEIVNLANELLPPLPQGMISLPVSSSLFMKGPLFKRSNAGTSSKPDDSNGNMQEVLTRKELLNDQPELLQQFGMDLLPVLVQIYGSSVNGPVRHKCLSVIGKLMYFSSSEMIQSLISVTNISSFLAGVLAWKDPQVLVPALQIAEILMEKLPDTFSKMFIREGVIHAVDALILTGPTSSSQPSPLEKENDSITGSSRSRRNRRRGSNPSSDANPDDKSSIPSIVSQPNTVEIPTLNSSLRATVSACAKLFKEKYFPSGAEGSESGATDDLIRLKNLCTKLNAGIDEQKNKLKGKSKASGPRLGEICARQEENLVEVITEMLREFCREGGVSTFEFIGSGAVASLLNYFTCGYFSKERISDSDMPKLRQQAIRRYRSFVSVALPSSVGEGNLVPMSVLVQKLQSALSSLERFPVVLSHSSRPSSVNARLSSGLSALSQPFKLRLCRAQGEKSLRDYSSNVVLIDPLASLAAVEDFLWPRVQRGESGQIPSVSTDNSEVGTAATGTGEVSPSAPTPATASRRQSTRSRSSMNIDDAGEKYSSLEKSLSSSKAKGKAVLKPNQEESRGPQTRNATRRRAALDKDNEMKSAEGATSSEDDELDISPVEIDEALVIEDDDISDDDDDDENDDVLGDDNLPMCMPDRVHDVKLTDSVEDSPVPNSSDGHNNATCSSSSRASAGGSLFGSRGAMSFAAAAMAGLASGNSKGVRGGRDRHGNLVFGSKGSPKLIFTAGGRQLSRHLTIYQAIQRQLVSDEDDEDGFAGSDLVSSDGSRLWTDIYTIMYQKADGQAERSSLGTISSTTPSKSTKANSSSNLGSSDASTQNVSLLDSILQGELPCDLERNNPTYNILALLRVLDGMNQLARRLRSQQIMDMFSEGKVSSLNELTTTGVRVPPEDFINGKLTPKLARQIQDALALCSGSLPSWCYQLTKACPFLFPFETRRQYFYSTAFGLSRALYRLQQQQGADGHGSAGDREVRVGRLQRQKVRVSRNRILDSAAKVMEMCSSQKAILEVEYFGEVGTGLGPTLEFYTLLSHELQKDGLGMWRSGSSSSGPSTEVDLDIIHVPLGLFPHPWSPNVDASDGSKFFKAESLVDHIKFDHGYTSKSPAIVNLLEIMCEFTPEQQRAFCQFVTGAPRLPPGGLAVLNPKLTIVRKLSANTTSTANNGTGPSESADDDLPSVMTCANYLKLPPYSSKEIMYKKLLYAISEGQGSFDLS